MPYITFALLFLISNPLWAANQNMQPLYDSPLVLVDMTYPQVAGNFLVYSQRVNHKYQVMQIQANNLYAQSKDISPRFDKEVVRNGVALSNGDIGFSSNRLKSFIPYIAEENRQHALAAGVFQTLLLPNHLTVSPDGKVWAFDSSLEATRQARIENQYEDGFLHPQLIGQAWRMYHGKLWAYKSNYPTSQTGLKNKFSQPSIFTMKRGRNEISQLGNGFDVSLSTDAKNMVFVREDNGNFDLWSQNIDGSNLTRLTKSTFADLEPTLSPDGKRVVFISNRDAGGDILQTSIYTLEIATGKINRITEGTSVTDGGPAWLDDDTIIFHSNRDPQAPNTNTVDNWRLWTVKLRKSSNKE
ncbi:MAG: hypothetical protein R8M46_04305 [Ghiorsea sp.]